MLKRRKAQANPEADRKQFFLQRTPFSSIYQVGFTGPFGSQKQLIQLGTENSKSAI